MGQGSLRRGMRGDGRGVRRLLRAGLGVLTPPTPSDPAPATRLGREAVTRCLLHDALVPSREGPARRDVIGARLPLELREGVGSVLAVIARVSRLLVTVTVSHRPRPLVSRPVIPLRPPHGASLHEGLGAPGGFLAAARHVAVRLRRLLAATPLPPR